jgi:2,3-bisphosphoglycerate-independent phosphoglycerate mutase
VKTPTKYVVCVPDGCADEPLDELDGRTPLEVAVMPNVADLARRGDVGRAQVIPPHLPPGSDVGNMSILGYDPTRFHTGRAPIEAAAMGIDLRPDQVAYRCNLVSVGDDGTMIDFAGGHPSTEDAREVIAALDSELGGDGVSFHAGVQYRHVVVAPREWADAECVPPHDLTDRQAEWPIGPAAGWLCQLMERSRKIVGGFGLAANQVWLWGQGPRPQMPSFRDAYGLEAGLVTAVDLVRGLGVLTGMDVVEVEGATGWFDTNYEGKRDAALKALADGADVFLVHVEATDEAGHAGNLEEKIKALEAWDARIIGPLVEGLDSMGHWRLLMVPDHATPIRLKTHTHDPVPYLLVDSEERGNGGEYDERGAAFEALVPGHDLMRHLLRRVPQL